MSGFTVNYDKTIILRIGSLRNSDIALLTKKTVAWTNEPINILGVWVSADKQAAYERNYKELYNKAKAVLRKWQNKTSSLLGKVMIVNVLVTSLFEYRMAVLPKMTTAMFKSMKMEITKYIWNGAKAKIPYNMLIQSKNEGGAGLVDLETKDKATKITWLSILKQEPDLEKIVYSNVSPLLKEKIWDCSLKIADVGTFIKDTFWKDVFEAWFEYKDAHDDFTRMNTEILWCNSSVRIANQPILWEKALRKGLIQIGQLFENGQVITKDEARNRYDLSVLSYNALISAIPRKYKLYFKENRANLKTDVNFTFANMMSKRKDLSKTVYRSLLKVESMEALKQRWRKDTCETLETDGFMQYHREIYVITNVPKLRSFQYRMLHRAIITNVNLYRWGRRDDMLCTFCNQEPETYRHLFVMCTEIRNLWILAEEKMYKFDDEHITFNVERVLFNQLVDKNPKNVKNFVCLLLKQYIYKQRCLGHKLNFEQFWSNVYTMRNIERFIATKNGHLTKFRDKWLKKESLSYYEYDVN